jgi:SAM-dependent methyltransferase
MVKDRNGFEVVGCVSCGLARLDPLPSQLEGYYHSNAYQDGKNPGQDITQVRSQPRKWEDTERRWSQAARLCVPGSRILDIGCGSGGFLHAARERSSAVVCGVEPHEEFRGRLSQDGFQVRQSLSECAGERYDVALLFHVLEHVEDPVRFLQEIRSLLKPGGTLVVEVPSMTDPLLWVYAIPAFWKFYWQYPHVWYFSPSPLGRVLERAGYAVERLELVQRYGLLNHLQWLNEGVPGVGERFADLVSPVMDQDYRAALVRREAGDTVWAESRVSEPYAA